MATVMGAGSPAGAHQDNEHDAGDLAAYTRCDPPGSDRTLSTLIEAEIISRLLVAHPAAGERTGPAAARSISVEDAAHFAALPLELEADELLTVVETFLARGAAVETVFVDLLAHSARKLGEYWEEDRCDFVQVTMGLWRLQEVMREITMRSPAPMDPGMRQRAALFTPMPGEQHSFGSLMVEEVFSRAGWHSEALIEPKRCDLLDKVAQHSFDLVGLTVSCDCSNGAIADMIDDIRAASQSSATQVFIGGRMINANPAIADMVGADGTAADARSALALAERTINGTQYLNLLVP